MSTLGHTAPGQGHMDYKILRRDHLEGGPVRFRGCPGDSGPWRLCRHAGAGTYTLLYTRETVQELVDLLIQMTAAMGGGPFTIEIVGKGGRL